MSWRDGLNFAATIATVGAAVLAWLAIRDSREQATKSAINLIRERRIDYELGLLKEIAQYNSWGAMRGDREEQIRFRLSLMPEPALQTCRRFFQLPVAPEAINEAAKRAGQLQINLEQLIPEECLADIRTAVAVRLEERSA